MKRTRIVAVIAAGIVVGSILTPTTASAGTICKNGSYSSNSGRGTCSWNGGIDRSYPSFSDPGSSSYKRQNGFGNSFNSRGNTFSDPFSSSRSRNNFSDPFSSSRSRNNFSDPFSLSRNGW